ncbi:MAG: LysM peptidoglycan-binding domain-containing protein [Desulfuromonadales bacterium]|jgi:hypothetical protein
MLRFFLYGCLILLVSACAKPPYRELSAAEQVVKRAHRLHALEFAPTEYQAAHSALQDARMAINATEYDKARDSLDFAVLHANRAIALSQDGQARQAAEEEARRIAEAEAAYQAKLAEEKARQIAERIARQQHKPDKAPPAASRPEPKTTPVVEYSAEYTVGEGETLWTISAQPEVYNEGLLWPLLYQANRDQIKDPREIFPGQVLSIRRDMTTEEREEARQKARESDIFPVPEHLRQPAVK